MNFFDTLNDALNAEGLIIMGVYAVPECLR
jgi:hypothetical protein